MRAMVFIDGQNLFLTSRTVFGQTDSFPPYDPHLIGEKSRGLVEMHLKQKREMSKLDELVLEETRFYTGIPLPAKEPELHASWRRKIADAEKRGVNVFSRSLQYIPSSDGGPDRKKEKGIDVRIALDVVMLGIKRQYDVAILFSRDNDFSEVAKEINELRRDPRFSSLRTVCCYPRSRYQDTKTSGIHLWDWCPFDENFYHSCRDPKDYRETRRRKS